MWFFPREKDKAQEKVELLTNEAENYIEDTRWCHLLSTLSKITGMSFNSGWDFFMLFHPYSQKFRWKNFFQNIFGPPHSVLLQWDRLRSGLSLCNTGLSLGMTDTRQALAQGPGQHCCIICRITAPPFPHVETKWGITMQALLSKASALWQPL